MPKAVLIMDMPERCADCPLRNSSHAKNSYVCCYLTLKDISETDYYDKKPDWCPLRELPEKKPELKSGYENLSTSIRQVGWNACLDAILKEPQNEGGAHGKEQSK